MPQETGPVTARWAPPPLPRSLSSFVGRRQEVPDVVALVSGAVPLVTLVGPGGVGKTRLALQIGEAVAASAGRRFADGVAFVRLDTIQDPALVASQIVRGLGLQEQANRTAEQVLADHLQDRRLLLILDNFEHLLDAALLVHDLLTAAPGLAVLTTSRVPLNLSGEYLYPVDPLALPAVPAAAGGEDSPVARADIEAVAAADAGRLFLERARARNPRFLLTPANARTVAQLCARLDGLPLAIELAAARLRTSGPAGLLRLESLLPSLDEGPRDAPARQLTIRDTLAWSYDRLPTSQQRVFRSLGVFVGGFTLDSAAAVAEAVRADSANNVETTSRAVAAPDPLEFLDELRALADQSLVNVDLMAEDEHLYSLLETTHEYALELLAAHDELRRARNAQARYFAAWLEQAETGLTGRDHELWGRRVDAELGNIRASLDWALDVEESLLEVGLEMAVTLWTYWDRRGYRQEAERWLRLALARSDSGHPELRARVSRRLGNTLHDNRLGEARAHYEEGLALARIADSKPLVAALLRNLAGLADDQGSYDEATHLFQEALGIFRMLSDEVGYARTLVNLGSVANNMGDFAYARSCVEEALGAFERLHNPEGMVGTYFQLGRIDRRAGRLDDAVAHLQYGSRLADATGEAEWAAYCRQEEATLAHLRGDDETALALLTGAFRILRRTGTDFGVVLCLDEFAAIAVAQGQPELAATIWGAVEARREVTGNRLAAAEASRRDLDVSIGIKSLGADAWAAAWRRGRTLPLANAAELAQQIRVSTTRAKPPATIPPRSTGPRLTTREIEVLRLAAENLTDKEIGERLSISRRTVTTHMENIFTKLDVRGRVEAVVYAIQQSLL